MPIDGEKESERRGDKDEGKCAGQLKRRARDVCVGDIFRDDPGDGAFAGNYRERARLRL